MPGPVPSIIGGGKPAIASAVEEDAAVVVVIVLVAVGGGTDRAVKASHAVEASKDNAISARRQLAIVIIVCFDLDCVFCDCISDFW